MHPKERTKIHGSPGLALVETPDQNHSDAERPSNRKPTQKSNRKQGSKNIYSFHLISILISVFQEELEALRARLEKVDKERLELKQTNEKLESRVSLSNDLTSKSTEMSLTMGVKESKKICEGERKRGRHRLSGIAVDLNKYNECLEFPKRLEFSYSAFNGT